MVLTIVNIVIIVTVVALIINCVEDYIKNKKRISISFKEAMELVELPVITFYNNDKKLNFLLDTGSNNSQINKSVLPLLDYEMINSKSTNIMGIEGTKINTGFCKLIITHNNNNYTDDFCINELDNVFNTIKQESGVQIHGILGSLFFQKYKYILDFKELKVYASQ